MLNTISCYRYFFVLGMLLLSTASIAGGVDPSLKTPEEQSKQINIDTQQQQLKLETLRLLREQQETQPDVRNELNGIQQPVSKASTEIPENESPCFIVNKIELVGDGARQFQFALDEVLHVKKYASKPNLILGQCLGVVGINAVMARVQNLILARGFITTRVLTTPQDLKTGILQLTIVAGRIGAIRLSPDSSRYISPWLALPLSEGALLNLRDIEQGLENLKRVPTAEANFQIEPSNTGKPGYSDVVIQYRQRFPARLSLSVDDSGLNSTGKYNGSTTLSLDNILALSDLFYLNYNHDLGGGDPGRRGAKGYSAYYSIPFSNWLLSVSTSSNDYHQEVAGASSNYIYSGSSQNSDIKLSRLIYRNNINKTNLSIRGFLRKSFNYIDDTEIEVQRRRTAGWELGFNQIWYLNSAIVDYSLGYRRGTGAMDALKAPEQAFDEGTSRMKMLIGDLNLNIPFGLQSPWGKQALQYSANLRGQANYTPLTPQDRFSIGNRFTVRGFDGRQTLIADHGWLIRNELAAPIANTGQSIYWGLDYGEVGGQSAEFLIGKYLAGTAIGLRGGVAINRYGVLGYDVFVAKPINKPQGFITHSEVAGFNFNLSF